MHLLLPFSKGQKLCLCFLLLSKDLKNLVNYSFWVLTLFFAWLLLDPKYHRCRHLQENSDPLLACRAGMVSKAGGKRYDTETHTDP